MPKNTKGIIPWKKGQSGNPKGRPRKLISTLKDVGYSNTEINQTLKNLAAMKEREIKNLVKDPEATVLERLFAKNIQKSLKKGSLAGIETLLNRAFGYPHEVAADPGEPPDASKELSDDPVEASKQYQELMK